MNTPEIASISNPNAQRAILTAGLVAGTLDILAACTQFYIGTGKNPMIVLKYVASGVFGATAMTGGTAVAVWGLVFHYMIAFGLTFFFFLAYPRLSIMRKNKWVTAVAYGLFAWCVTNLIIVPLSKVTRGPFHPDKALIAAAILICMIGIPITLIIGNYYDKKGE
jgi:hypothetical protein